MNKQQREVKRVCFLAAVLLAAACNSAKNEPPGSDAGEKAENQYTGSASCRPCHEKFYQLWEPSHHGKAMQPFTAAFAKAELVFDMDPIPIGEFAYRARLADGRGYVVERGKDGETRYEMIHVLGGKNVYYFLTPMKKGRLQVLPLGYEVHKKTWFDVAKSGVRHFADHEDDPIHWTDSDYTFNTSCFGCHVSQLVKNYDLATDTYRTEWQEPGINCETCHGPSAEHIAVCANAPKGTVPEDLKIIRGGRDFTAEQNNATCASCHAKMVPLSGDFVPGDKFFDHFDLATLEHPDYYPDGRDLGENYTFTSWRMSGCAKAGELDCLDCHTSGGRFIQKDNPASACAPCHQDKIDTVAEHSHHPAGEDAPTCISCHMPMTSFAHMNRSDHSMAPPVPAATLVFGSPNACNLCHSDRDAAWADKKVSTWHGDERKKAVLHRGHLVAAARKGDWSELDNTLAFVADEKNDEVTRASLLRLLMNSGDLRIVDTATKALSSASPLVRSAAVQVLDSLHTIEAIRALLAATKDPLRLVRIRAAAALAGLPEGKLKPEHRDPLRSAMEEFFASITARPDDYASHYNLGNAHLDRGKFSAAVAAYQTAAKLRPDALPIWINLAMAYHGDKKTEAALLALENALSLAPQSEAVHLNLAMLLGELGRLNEARKHFARGLEINPKSSMAAYNLCVLDAEIDWKKALPRCKEAWTLEPGNPKYGYTLAFYQYRNGREKNAIQILEAIIEDDPPLPGAYALLVQIYQDREKPLRAQTVLRKAAANSKLPPQERARFERLIQ